MFNILKLNEISKQATKALDSNYSLSNDCANPEAIILRSFDMHDYTTGSNLLAVVRAGAGVNNIPIEEMTAKQVAVFNTPGANSNAVKELAICALLLGSRKIVEGIEWTKSLNGKGDEVPALVEKGKKAFVGGELKGKKLGVVGLGAIGRMVANTACDLGMEVLGYDPYLSIDGAWSLKEKVQHITSLNKIFTNCDYITLHVPMTDSTKNCINAETISLMKNDVVILNLARGGLVNDDDIIAALEKNEVGCYITDLPNEKLLNAKNCICIPHLGASTPEAEDNCATMAVFELKEYLESGNIINSVNFPCVAAPRSGAQRVTILYKNVPNMIATATKLFADANINISNMVNSSKGDIAYMILDLDSAISKDQLDRLQAKDNFLLVRSFN